MQARYAATLVIGMLMGSDPPLRMEQQPDSYRLLQGEWRLVKAVSGGEDCTDNFDNFTLRFTRTQMMGVVPDGGLRYKADASRSPATFDMELEPGRWNRGIWRIDGDTLTTCAGATRGPRPTEFGSPSASTINLPTFQRVTP